MSKRARPAKRTKVATAAATERPEGWTAAPLRAVTRDVQSINPNRQPTRRWRYADIGGVDSARNVVGEVRTFLGKEAPSRARRPVESGDVLFSNVRVNLRRIAAIPHPAPVDVCSTGFTLLRSNGAIDPRFLLHSVLRSQFVDEVADTQTGTQYPATSDRQVRGASVLIPPMAEQRRIADALDTTSNQLRLARQRVRAAAALAEHLVSALMLAACSGCLMTSRRVGPDNAPSLESELRDLSTSLEKRWHTVEAAKTKHRRTKYKAPPPPSTFWLDELPPGWRWTSLASLAYIDTGYAFKSSEFANAGTRLLRGENVSPGALRWTDTVYLPPERVAQYEYLSVKEGDLILGMDRPVISSGLKLARARKHDLPCVLVQRVARIASPQPDLAEYLELVLKTPHFVDHLLEESTGSDLPHVVGDTLASFAVPLPPADQRKAIVATARAAIARVETLRSRLEEAAVRIRQLYSSTARAAFAGHLVPTEAELAHHESRPYESGEQLLARIRSQPVPVAQTREVPYEGSDVSFPRVLIMKKLQEIGKTHLFDLLVKGSKGMTPQELLLASELDVDDFYTQLKREVEAKKVKEIRKGKTGVILEAAR